MSRSTQQSYAVVGMSCEHCAAAIDAQLTQVPGVREVEVDLASGRVLISSSAALDEDAVREAVEAAGYALLASS